MPGFMSRRKNKTNLQRLNNKLEELVVDHIEKEQVQQAKPATKEIELITEPTEGKGVKKKIKTINTKCLLTR